jgi:hypothetical protein
MITGSTLTPVLESVAALPAPALPAGRKAGHPADLPVKRIGWLTLLALLVLGISMTSHSDTMKSIAFRAVSNPQPWAIGDNPSYLVVTEKNWASYYSNQPKGADFTANIYIVASLGLKPNPGYTVRILQLQQQGEVINVKLELGEPAPNKFYIQVMVKPIAVAEVPKANLQSLKQPSFVFVDQKGKELATVKTEI